ncbi:cob(I)yrinic acid a,c-diamide adenosyltransferase, partial [Candidatus Woesearchaeota archaeon]|nr:cob(I)yrinic acid a,c-diamide adenosyltransferase [Candidatus Woesearchaeota archaeon]
MVNNKKKALVYVWTGTGSGKTTSALGAALRQAGHGHKVIFIQFMKGRKYIGEYKIMKRLKPNYQIFQFGREGWVDTKHPEQKDKELAHKGLDFAYDAIKKKPDLLVLDEINIAVAIGLLPEEDVITFLDAVPQQTVVYLTGRYAPPKIMWRADYVTEFVTLKQPEKIVPR